jgi:DNA repair protein RadC
MWWAHFKFTPINITPTILRKKVEELMNVKGIGEKSFLKLKALVVVPAKADKPAGQ